MKYEKGSFPLQKISKSRKGTEWKEHCVDYIINSALNNVGAYDTLPKADMKAMYNLYNGVHDEKRLAYVTNPFKQNDAFPAKTQNINLLKPQVDTLLGELESMPWNFVVTRTSDSVTSDIQSKLHNDLMEYMMSAMFAKMSPEDQAIHEEKLQTGEIQLPEEIQSYYSKSYKDISETIANKSLKYLHSKLNLETSFKDGFKDALLAAMEVYYVGDKAGKPFVERVNPLHFYYATSPDLDFIHDAQWCARRMQMSPQEIHDRFFGKVPESDMNKIEDLVNGTKASSNKLGIDDSLKHAINAMNRGESPLASADTLDVWHTCWHSYKKILFVTLIDDAGEMSEFQADEDYIPTGEEVYIETEWATETWEGYRVGEDIYFGVSPLDYQYIDSETLNSTRLPYTGAVYYNTNSAPKSFASFIEPLQYYSIMLWYRIELAMARDKGKIFTMDMTQIPKNWDMGMSKWLHMIHALGINFVNPYETGWDTPGRAGGQRADFNQFASHDLTTSDTIVAYLQMLAKVEMMAEALTGVTPQRKGDIKSNELVGNVTQSIERSANITAALFGKHRAVTREVLAMLLNTAKIVWSINKPASLHYVFEDGERLFFDVTEDFLYEDFDIFVTDSRDEAILINELRALYQPAMQNGASLLDVAEIMTIKNVSEIKAKLTEIEVRRQEREDAIMQQQQEAEMAIVEKQQEIQEMLLQDKEADRDVDVYKIDTDSRTKIHVAEIGAYKYQEDLDANKDGIPDPIQIGELALKEQEAFSKEQEREMTRSVKQKEIKSKELLQDKKLAGDKQLQKQKDDAAMEREKLKAKTALRNPVVGEKSKTNKK